MTCFEIRQGESEKGFVRLAFFNVAPFALASAFAKHIIFARFTSLVHDEAFFYEFDGFVRVFEREKSLSEMLPRRYSSVQ